MDAVPTLSAVLFDFKDTLAFVAEEAPTLADVARAKGIELRLPVVVGPDDPSGASLRSDASSETAFWDAVRQRRLAVLVASGVARTAAEQIVEEVEAGRSRLRMALFPEVRGVLGQLREAGLALGVCSNWDWDLDKHISDLGLDGHFDAVVGSARCGYWKPHETIFRLALDAIGAQPPRTLFVGDNLENDVRPAVAVGMTALHVHRRGRCEGGCQWSAVDLRGLPVALGI